ncbi:hypothetical protein CLU79DRAFT_841184 [Phycomyces nitens]|nr:hypothetical protein CLU79DRAFT_841184 [Phycomyces nitens]
MKSEPSKAISLRLPSDALSYLHHSQEGRKNIKINVTSNGITIVLGNKVYPINIKKVDAASHMYKRTGSSDGMYHVGDISHKGTLGEPSMIKEPSRKPSSTKTNDNTQQQKRERPLDEEDKRDLPDTKKLKKPASKRPVSAASITSGHLPVHPTVRESHSLNSTESSTKNNNPERSIIPGPRSASHSQTQHSTTVLSGSSQSKIKTPHEKPRSTDSPIRKTSSVDVPLRKVKSSEVSGKRPSSMDHGARRPSNADPPLKRQSSIEPPPKRKYSVDPPSRRPSNVDPPKRTNSTDTRPSRDALRKEIIHLLAVDSIDTKALCRKLDTDSQLIMPILKEVALLCDDQWHLFPAVHLELNIWEWPGYSEKTRRIVIQNTRKMYDKAMKLSPDAPERANLIAPATYRSRPNSSQHNTSSDSSPLKDKTLFLPRKRDRSRDESRGKQGLLGSARRRSDQLGYVNGNERQKSSHKSEERVDQPKSTIPKTSLPNVKATKESRETSRRSVSPTARPKQSKTSKPKPIPVNTKTESKLETSTPSSSLLSPSPTKLSVLEPQSTKTPSKASAKIPPKNPGNTPTPTKVLTPTKFTEPTKVLTPQRVPVASKTPATVKPPARISSKKPPKLVTHTPTPPQRQVSQSPPMASAAVQASSANVSVHLAPQTSSVTMGPRYSSKGVGLEKKSSEDPNDSLSSNCFPRPYRAPSVNSQTQFSRLCLEHKEAQEEVKLLNETIDEQCPIIHEMLAKAFVEVKPTDDVMDKLKAAFLDLDGHPDDWTYAVYFVKRLFWLRQKLELLYPLITTAHGLQGYVIPEDV